ncbi:unnamed protein product [Ranitomeya imitator]|uniref:Uncharacterized protein n=1 Tax=Ranitomeya imitator TaxID=111125 RepID=A0ABN9MH83_9NEOB|nr:unnamed protein product [Ranitomeya imitator]
MVVDDEEKANILNTFFSTVFTAENEMLGEIPRNNENPILRVTNLTQEEDWRIANVVPIFKKGSKSEPGNYRPSKPDLNTTLPIRQTASIFKQPVTKITNHPNNKVRSDPQRVIEQPRQVSRGHGHSKVIKKDLCVYMYLFWEKRLEGLSASDVTEQVISSMELPKGLQGVGPGNNEDTLLAAIASALHTSSAPITGQLSAAVEKNPSVWLNTLQPLCKAFIVTDEDIR